MWITLRSFKNSSASSIPGQLNQIFESYGKCEWYGIEVLVYFNTHNSNVQLKLRIIGLIEHNICSSQYVLVFEHWISKAFSNWKFIDTIVLWSINEKYFLFQSPLTLETPNQVSLGQLWLELLKFYTLDFALEEYVICVRIQDILTRENKNWPKRRIAIEGEIMCFIWRLFFLCMFARHHILML